jgi:hypothetical protein
MAIPVLYPVQRDGGGFLKTPPEAVFFSPYFRYVKRDLTISDFYVSILSGGEYE